MSFSTSYIIKLVDKFSPNASKIVSASDKLYKAFDKLSKGTKSLRNINNLKFGKLTGSMRKVDRMTQSATRHMREYGQAVKTASKYTMPNPHRPGGGGIPGAGGGMSSIHGSLNQAALSAGVGGAALFAGIGAALKASGDFSTNFAHVKKAYDFADESQANFMKNNIIMASRAIPSTAASLADLSAEMFKTGMSMKEVTDILPMVGRTAIAFDLEMGEAGEIVARTKNFFKLNKEELESYLDYVNELDKNYSAKANTTARITQRYLGGQFKVQGASAKEAAAFATAIQHANIQAQRGARALNTVIGRLNAGKFTGSKEDILKLYKMGFDIDQHVANISENLSVGLVRFFEDLKSHGKDAGKILTSVMGFEPTDEMLQLMSMSDDLKDMLKLIGKGGYSGSMMEEFSNQMDTLPAQLKITQNKLTAIGIVLGDLITPEVKKMNKFLGQVFVGLNDLIKNHPGIVRFGMAFAAAAGSLLLMGAGIRAAVWAITPFVEIVKFLGTSTFFKGLGANVNLVNLLGSGFRLVTGAARVLLGPWGLLVAGFASAMAYILPVTEILKFLGMVVLNKLVGMFNATVTAIESAKTAFNGIKQAAQDALGPVIQLLEKTGALQAIKGVAGWVGDQFNYAKDQYSGYFQTMNTAESMKLQTNMARAQLTLGAIGGVPGMPNTGQSSVLEAGLKKYLDAAGSPEMTIHLKGNTESVQGVSGKGAVKVKGFNVGNNMGTAR